MTTDWRKITFEKETDKKEKEMREFLSPLSDEERKVLSLISEMKSELEISVALNKSVKVVDDYKQRICMKLNFGSNYTLLKFAYINRALLQA